MVDIRTLLRSIVRLRSLAYTRKIVGTTKLAAVTRKDDQLWCDACNKPVNYPKPRYWLEVIVKDADADVVVVLWDETATELTKLSAKALLDGLADDDGDDTPAFPATLTDLYGTRHLFEIKSHTYYNYGEFESFTCTGVFLTENEGESEVQEVCVFLGDLPSDNSNNENEDSQEATGEGPHNYIWQFSNLASEEKFKQKLHVAVEQTTPSNSYARMRERKFPFLLDTYSDQVNHLFSEATFQHTTCFRV